MSDIDAATLPPAVASPAEKQEDILRELAEGSIVVSVARPASSFQALISRRRTDVDVLSFAHPDIVLCMGDTEMESTELLMAAGNSSGCLIGAKPWRICDRLARVGPLKGRENALTVETLDSRVGNLRRCDLLHLADCADPIAMLEGGRTLLNKAARVLVEFRPEQRADMQNARADLQALLATCGLTTVAAVDDRQTSEACFIIARRGWSAHHAPVVSACPQAWSGWQDAFSLPAIGMHAPEGHGARSIRWCGPLGRSVFGLWLPRPGRYRFVIRAIDGKSLTPATVFRCFVGASLEKCRQTIGEDGLVLEAEFEIPELGFSGYVELGLLLPDGAMQRKDGRKVGIAIHGIEVATVDRARVLG